jgi:uncharacterized protein
MNHNAFGLTASDMEKIISIISREETVEEAILFGSRAKGNYRAGSDVDIALKGEKLEQKIANSISSQLNDVSLMPYKFDILNYNSIDNKELVEHIDRVGIVLFKRKSSPVNN